MNYEELYEAEKAKREAAEAQVAELQGIVRATREDERLVEAALAAGVPAKAAKACAAAIRRSADVTFDERTGAFRMGELEGVTYFNPQDLVHGFLSRPEGQGFTAEHIAAVDQANGVERPAESGASVDEAGVERFHGAEAWKNGDPVEIAELAWKNPPPPPPAGPDPFAEFLEDRS